MLSQFFHREAKYYQSLYHLVYLLSNDTPHFYFSLLRFFLPTLVLIFDLLSNSLKSVWDLVLFVVNLFLSFFVTVSSLDFLLLLVAFKGVPVVWGEGFESKVVVSFALAPVSSIFDNVWYMALTTLGVVRLSWSSLLVSLIPCAVSLAAFVAACIDSASSVTTPLSLNALTASRVEIAASRILFAASFTVGCLFCLTFRLRTRYRMRITSWPWALHPSHCCNYSSNLLKYSCACPLAWNGH